MLRPSLRWRALTLSVTAATALSSCEPAPLTDDQRAIAIVIESMIGACPVARPDDRAAFQRCADNLTNSTALRDMMNDPFLWGQQRRLWNYDLSGYVTTRFSPRIFRRMYLSLFMFTGTYTIETVGDLTVVHVPYVFRSGLDPGEYPYPFWHTANKWRDYHLAIELHLIFRGRRMLGALRSAVRLNGREYTPRDWDGQWKWDSNQQPSVTLFRNLFSATNPHVQRLDTAYRDLEENLRPYACERCHSPDNQGEAQSLELFSYPNQALTARTRIRVQLERNEMPPGGISDVNERNRLIGLARAFESAAQDALRADGEGTENPALLRDGGAD